MQRSFPLKTAALFSARFPIVSPAAYIENKDNKSLGKLLDGGFYDNSGLSTALSLSRFITDFTSTDSTTSMVPVIIFIRNANLGSKDSIKTSSELNAPIKAFYNSWLTNTEQKVKDMEWLSHKIGFKFIQIRLDHTPKEDGTEYPLGWTLSVDSQQKMINQLNKLDTTYTNQTLHNDIVKVNYSNLRLLVSYEKSKL